jgi:hypothetical protein
MSELRQLRLARRERIKQRGIWRFAFFKGVLGFGLSMGIITFFLTHVSRKPVALPWYSVFGACLVAGFGWGLAMYFFTMWSYSRTLKSQ